MNNSELIQPHHRARKAVIYIRQSSGHQVLSNVESRALQHAMRDRALALGWDESRVEVVEADTGTSAASTVGREGYKLLLSQIVLGLVGLVLSYESTRLSRNCSDWYPLLDVCTDNDCLIADRDGVYDPSTANGRLLLGMKGIISEVELHTLRGRLVAGILQKAKRGELALKLPIGLVRLPDGRVTKDPNLQIQEIIALVFATFLARGSTTKVVRHLREGGLRVPRRHPHDEVVWREACVANVIAVLKNPGYAGTFVYGRTRHDPRGRSAQGRPVQRRRPMDQWRIVVHNRYPAFIPWDTFVKVQAMLQDNYAAYDRNRSRGVPRDGAALLHGITYCGACGHKMIVQYKGRVRYLCNYARQETQCPVCQHLPADAIDRHVIAAFFEALSPVHLDAYDAAMRTRTSQQAEIVRAQERELQRLRYEVDLARRQYTRVDPDNRLVATELERRWEEALRDLSSAELRTTEITPAHDVRTGNVLSPELRHAFESLGTSLPALWQRTELKREQRKALLRCLIDKVVAHRVRPDLLRIRIVWHGGEVSEGEITVAVGSIQRLSRHEELERLVVQHADDGTEDKAIATLLNAQGFRSPKCERLLVSTVRTIRLKSGRLRRYKEPRPRTVAGFLTIPQVARTLGVAPHWLYYQICRGRIDVERDDKTRLYLFPDDPATIDQLRRLQATLSANVSS